jgi:uncharacterized membrane protein YdbT with pleckstrin-like domain
MLEGRSSEAPVSYLDKELIPGEKIIYRTRLHWLVILGPFLLGVICEVGGAAAVFYAISNSAPQEALYKVFLILGGTLLIAGSLLILVGVLRRNATEIGITDKRVLIKTGMAGRRSLEIVLSKVESIGVVETAWGRLLGYGTVTIHGTGGTPEPFPMIARPNEFRKQVQQQIASL